MPVIVDLRAYDGFERRIERLGLSPIVDGIKQLITGFDLRVAETRHANDAAVIRERLDDRFAAIEGALHGNRFLTDNRLS